MFLVFFMLYIELYWLKVLASTDLFFFNCFVFLVCVYLFCIGMKGVLLLCSFWVLILLMLIFLEMMGILVSEVLLNFFIVFFFFWSESYSVMMSSIVMIILMVMVISCYIFNWNMGVVFDSVVLMELLGDDIDFWFVWWVNYVVGFFNLEFCFDLMK